MKYVFISQSIFFNQERIVKIMAQRKFAVVVGIDVSKKNSSVCIVINRKEYTHFVIENDLIGFKQLQENLECFTEPLLVFEATGVYSLPLQSFLDRNGYDYIRLNPLKAKKLMDNNLRHNKTDKVDAHKLALIQFAVPQELTPKQDQRYHEMQNASRFYEELTNDFVKAKNRLHRALQSTFPQIEQINSDHSGQIYWQIVGLFPHAQLVLDSTYNQIFAKLKKIKGISSVRADSLACSLQTLAKRTCYYDSAASITIEIIERCIKQLRYLDSKRQTVLDYIRQLVPNRKDLALYLSVPGIGDKTAPRLIAELGDLRRFDNPNQIDAFIGIDPGRYQSGEKDSHTGITKHGNAIARKILYRTIVQMETVRKIQPCHITDYYDCKKQLSQSKGSKKAAIASVHKLIRTMYALIINDQPYDYFYALSNQK